MGLFFKLLFIVFNHISTALFVNMWGLGDLFVCKVVKVIVVGGVTVVTILSQRERLCECFPRCCLCDVMQRSAIVKLRRRHREQGRRKTRTRARNNNNPKIPKKTNKLWLNVIKCLNSKFIIKFFSIYIPRCFCIVHRLEVFHIYTSENRIQHYNFLILLMMKDIFPENVFNFQYFVVYSM